MPKHMIYLILDQIIVLANFEGCYQHIIENILADLQAVNGGFAVIADMRPSSSENCTQCYFLLEHCLSVYCGL